MDMGFSREHAIDALTHTSGLEQATEYILMHPPPPPPPAATPASTTNAGATAGTPANAGIGENSSAGNTATGGAAAQTTVGSTATAGGSINAGSSTTANAGSSATAGASSSSLLGGIMPPMPAAHFDMDIGDEEQMMRAIAMSLGQSFAEVTGQAPLEVNWGI